MIALFTWLLMLALPTHHPSHHHTEICPGAYHFYSGPPPAWAEHKRVICRIGAHTFTN